MEAVQEAEEGKKTKDKAKAAVLPQFPKKEPWNAVQEAHVNHEIPLKSYRERLAIFTTAPQAPGDNNGHNDSNISHMYRPFVLPTTVPAVTFSALVYGSLVGLGNVIYTTLSTYMP